MAELAGYLNQVFALAGESAMTGSTGAKVLSINNSSFNELCDLLETTAFGDTYKRRIGGLKDTNVTISGVRYAGDVTGQEIFTPGAIVFIGIYPSGTTVAGKQVKVIVESVEYSSSVDGMQEISISLQGLAAPVALPLRP